jgi:hypothetical protein
VLCFGELLGGVFRSLVGGGSRIFNDHVAAFAGQIADDAGADTCYSEPLSVLRKQLLVWVETTYSARTW